MSVKIEDSVKAELLRVAGEYQTTKKVEVTLSDAIEELIKEHDKHKEA